MKICFQTSFAARRMLALTAASVVLMMGATGCASRAGNGTGTAQAFGTPIVTTAGVAPSFTSRADNFAIWLPGVPQQNEKEVDDGRGGKTKVTMVQLNRHPVTYLIIPTLIPAAAAKLDSARFLDSVQDGYLSSLKVGSGQLKGTRDVSLQNYPGREMTSTLGSNVILSRFFLTAKRSYHLSAIATEAEAAKNGDEINKVLDSFQILEK